MNAVYKANRPIYGLYSSLLVKTNGPSVTAIVLFCFGAALLSKIALYCSHLGPIVLTRASHGRIYLYTMILHVRTRLGLRPPGGHLNFRLDIILVKGRLNHTLNTYFSGTWKLTLNTCFSFYFLSLMSFPKFVNINNQKHILFFQICTFLHPLWCTCVHWLVLKNNNKLCEFFYKDDIYPTSNTSAPGLARYKWPHSFSCAARCCKRQIHCVITNATYNRDPVPAKFKHVTNIETCTLLCCDYSTLWEALHANKVEIGARCSDKNVKILGNYRRIGW